MNGWLPTPQSSYSAPAAAWMGLMMSAMKRTMTKIMRFGIMVIGIIVGLELAGVVSAVLHWGGCE